MGLNNHVKELLRKQSQKALKREKRCTGSLVQAFVLYAFYRDKEIVVD